MRIIRPTIITDATLVSSSVSETDAPVYVSTTTYAINALVIYQHRVYKSLQASNVGNTPGITASAAWWSDQGPTNMWAMFDGVVSTPTVATGSLTVVLQPGITDSIALLSIIGTSVTVSMTVNGVTVYSVTESIIDVREKTNAYAYCFSPSRQRTKFYKTDLPPYLKGVITITISGNAAVACGMLVVGKQMLIGGTQYDAAPGIDDYSVVSFNAFGVGSLIVRNFSPNQSVQVMVDNVNLDFIYAQMADLRAQPLVWLGTDGVFDCLVTYGIYRQFKPVIKYLSNSICSLEIKGMI
ncbi:hypothetical protein ACO0K9_00920 [Undibacterium sp. Ji50W]|uniref:hypothetical protein n=1 Tax=Undibacterium sp. Ji50W TaxID=3413041 RepID=UPI003BF015A5